MEKKMKTQKTTMMKQMKKKKKKKKNTKKMSMTRKHKMKLCILSSIYPPHRLLTLKDLLTSLLLPSFPSPELARASLLHKDDPEDYVSLLQHGYGILSDSAPPIDVSSLEQNWTHQEVIERAIQIQFRQGNNTSNVLCFGFQQPRPTSSLGTERITPSGLACVSDSAAIAILSSQTWNKIHSRVGDSIMLYLLSHADIFHPLPRRCFVQIAGTSVILAAEHSTIESFNSDMLGSSRGKKGIGISKSRKGVSIVQNSSKQELHEVNLHSSTSRTNADTDMENKQTIAKCSLEIMTSESSKKRPRTSCWQRCKVRRCANQDTAVASSAVVKQTTTKCSNDILTSKSSRKRSRPSSWQRRKMRRHGNQEFVMENSGNEILQCANKINEAEISVNCFYASLSTHSCMEDGVKLHLNKKVTENKFSETLVSEIETDVCVQRTHKALNGSKMWVNSSFFPYNVIGCGHPDMRPMNVPLHQKPFLPISAHQDGIKKRDEQIMEMQNPISSKVTTKAKAMPEAQGTEMGRKVIDRARIFYKAKFPHHAGLPKNHILHKLKCTSNDAAILFKDIFEQQSECNLNDSGQCACLFSKKYQDWMCCLLRKLISNAKHCQYACLLERHCPAIHFKASMQPLKCKKTILCHLKGSVTQNKKSCTTSSSENNAVSSETNFSELFSSHSQVVAFLWAVCRRVIPEDLLGSKANWRTLRKNIFDFVHLRRYECCTLQQCMFKLKLSGYRWCQEQSLAGYKTIFTSDDPEYQNLLMHGVVNDAEFKSGKCVMSEPFIHRGKKKNFSSQRSGRIMLEKWIEWLFSSLLIPLLQAHFYVTESEKYRQDVLFYRKCVWAKMKKAALADMLKSNFTRLSTKSTVKLLKDRALGYSRARLLPKKSGMRLIANLGSFSALPDPSHNQKNVKRISVEARSSQGSIASSKCSSKSQILTQRNERLASQSTMAVDKKLVTVQDGVKLKTFRSKLVFRPINIILRDVHYCLKFEQENHSANLGCSVFDYNDIYLKLIPFIVDFKSSQKAASPLYLVVCDILKAYDTIKQDKLIDIMEEFIQEPEYCVRRYSYTSRSLKSLASPPLKPIKVRRERSAMSMEKKMNFLEDFIQMAAKHVNAVCVDQAHTTNMKEKYIKNILQEHIMRNVVQIGQQFYLQVVGIPQGSILSSLFCSLYFGHLERYRLALPLHLNQNRSNAEVYPPLPLGNKRESSAIKMGDAPRCLSKTSDCSLLTNACIRAEGPRNILLRLVDDFLFISDSQDNAVDFVIKMHKGFVEYNCVANRRKTALSFDGHIGGSHLKMNVYRTEDGACYMRWSGLLINCNTLEVQADYTRYAGINLQSTLTVWRRNNQGCHLMTKLCQFMRPKCHPIFYDTNINSPATAFLNAYQAFLLCAMKFHAYNRSLPCNGKCTPEFGFKTIKKTARYMHSLLEHRTRKISSLSQVKPIISVHAKEFEWLALCAFHRALLQKQSRYKKLLGFIAEELQCHRYNEFRSAPAMTSALDARRSSMFKYVVY